MFTADRRRQVRERLLERARADSRLVGAAITGSAARDAEDQWSDIDLFFGVTAGVSVADAVQEWSDHLYGEFGAVHHFDLSSGPATYRAFLLDDLLEVDLGFTPASTFGPRGKGAFRVVFGEPAPRVEDPAGTAHVVGFCWHHVLHARVCTERGALWSAEFWVSALRDHTLTLASGRLGLDTHYAKGADHLPADTRAAVADALVRALEPGELRRALAAATQAFVAELRHSDPRLADTLGARLLDAARATPPA